MNDEIDENIDLLENDFDKSNRTVFLFGDIDVKSCLKCIKALMILDKTEGPITLYINSAGGDTVDGWALIDFISKMKNPVDGIVFGSAFSMASVILQICRVRSMTRHSCMMIHAGSISMENDTNSTILTAEYLKKDLAITMDFYKRKSNISSKKMKELMSQDSFLDPTAALKLGLIDHIV